MISGIQKEISGMKWVKKQLKKIQIGSNQRQ